MSPGPRSKTRPSSRAADDLTLVADSHHAVWTTAKAGAAGGTAVSPVVAVAYVDNDTTARIGSESHASTLNLTGGLTVQAKHTATAQTTADASVASDKVGVGAAVGISIIADSTTATVARDITAGGTAEIKASATQVSHVDITASAKGNKSKEDGGKTAMKRPSPRPIPPRAAPRPCPRPRTTWLRPTPTPPIKPTIPAAMEAEMTRGPDRPASAWLPQSA
jgi:hypothetical protein